MAIFMHILFGGGGVCVQKVGKNCNQIVPISNYRQKKGSLKLINMNRTVWCL